MAESFRLFLLGGFRLEKAGKPVQVSRKKAKALLAYLALFPGVYTREQLATLFFPDDLDQAARKNLRVLLAELYKTLGAEFFSGDRDAVELNAEKIWVDAVEIKDEFRRMKDEAMNTSRSSLILHPSSFDLLPELYDDWVLQKREELRERRVDALLQVVEHARAQSEYAQAIGYAQNVLQLDRANERAHQHLMFLYAAQGDRTAALNQFEACIAALEEELGVEPAVETIALAKKIKQQKTGATSEATRLTNLPKPLTSFVGREREIGEIREMLGRAESVEGGANVSLHASRSTLTTLFGPGGSGKTRLAIESGRALVEEFEHGVWWVELAPLSDGALVPQHIAKALGIAEQPNEPVTQTLVNGLRRRELLLILDNCEHLVEAAAQLAETLVRECERVKILATSREGLNIAGEQVVPVAPLGVPRANEISLTQLALEFSAVRLFVERARLAQPQFVLEDANAPQVIQICQRLDGIPLALELAAARVKQMNVREIATRLDQRFELLVGARTALPRQQTLRALMDWSYDLLNEDERVLFRRVSVFAGGWTIESAEEVCADDTLPRAKILGALLRLVDKALVTTTAGTDTRYTLLETIREYAREKLSGGGRAADEMETLRARHYDYFTAFAERADAGLWSAEQTEWLAHLEAEHNNLRVALTWAMERATPDAKRGTAMRLAGALGHFWDLRGHVLEGEQWLERALEVDANVEHPNQRARALTSAGSMAWQRGELQRALHFHSSALALYRQAGNMFGVAFALNNVGVQHAQVGDSVRGLEMYHEGLAVARENHLDELARILLNNVGMAYLYIGKWKEAEAYLQEGLRLSERAGDSFASANSLHNLGDAARVQQNWERALELFEASMQICHAQGYRDHLGVNYLFRSLTLVGLNRQVEALADARASLAVFQDVGDKARICESVWAIGLAQCERAPALAAQLFGAADRLRTELDFPMQQDMQETDRAARTQIIQTIGGEAFERAYARGSQLSLEEVMALAAET